MLFPIFFFFFYLLGLQYVFEIRIFLKRREVPTCILGDPVQSARLGWSTWVKSPEYTHPQNPFISFMEKDLFMN
jgi:predicted component of type VI protein secretion system